MNWMDEAPLVRVKEGVQRGDAVRRAEAAPRRGLPPQSKTLRVGAGAGEGVTVCGAAVMAGRREGVSQEERKREAAEGGACSQLRTSTAGGGGVSQGKDARRDRVKGVGVGAESGGHGGMRRGSVLPLLRSLEVPSLAAMKSGAGLIDVSAWRTDTAVGEG